VDDRRGVLAVGEIATLGFFLGPIAIAADAGGDRGRCRRGPRGSVDRVHRRVARVAARAAADRAPAPARRRRSSAPGTAALVGGPATVLERVDRDGGQVKIGGEVWSARAYDEDDSFEPGARVEVMKIDGATALVANERDWSPMAP
jgi:hypothetical protein